MQRNGLPIDHITPPNYEGMEDKILRVFLLKQDSNLDFIEAKQYTFDYSAGKSVTFQLNTPIKVMNPTTVTQKSQADSALLRRFLTEEVKKGNYQFGRGLYRIEDNWVYLTHEIVYRPKKDFKTGEIVPRYSVLETKPLGKGSFGAVYDIVGTLSEDKDDSLLLDTEKERIIKVQSHKEGTETALRGAANEEKLLRMVHAKSKPLVSQPDPDPDIEGKATSYLVMRKFPGKPLHALRKELAQLSIEERLLLSRNLLLALQQIHDRGIVHRDIKPENILVDLDTMEVNIIDLGNSIKAADIAPPKETDFIGTPPYMSPEALANTSPIDHASDISSMGFTLANSLWGATERRFGFGAIEGDPQLKEKVRAMYQAFLKGEEIGYLKGKKVGETKKIIELDGLLTNVAEGQMYEAESNDVSALIQNMTAVDKKKRPSLDKSIALFDQLLLDKALADIPDEKMYSSLKKAHEVGLETRQALRKIAHSKPNDQTLPQPLTQLGQTIEAGLDQLEDDSPLSIKAFIRTAGVATFTGMTTKDEIRQQTKQIVDQFETAMETLLALSGQVEMDIHLLKSILAKDKQPNQALSHLITDMTSFLADIKSVLKEDTLRSVALDDLNALSKTFTKRINDFTGTQGRIKNLHLGERFKLDHIRFYGDLLEVAPPDKTQPSAALKQLQDKIKFALKYYVDSTLTANNIKNNDRAASDKRINNIKTILTHVNHATDPDQLIAQLEKDADDIRSGFGFKFRLFSVDFGGSALRDLIRHEITEYKKEKQLNLSARHTQ